jgi:hypothetical protein
MDAVTGGVAGTETGFRPTLRLTTRNARLEMKTEQPSRLEIHNTYATFEVDSTRARSEMGYESFTAFMRKERDRAMSLAAEGVRRRVSEGQRLMDILHEPKSIKNMAREKSVPHRKRHEYGIGLKPKSPPDITWYTGSVEINYTPSVLGGTYTPGGVDIQV